MKEVFKLRGLCCAACAAKAERRIAKINGITIANYNFMTEKLTLEYTGEREKILDQVREVIRKTEKSAELHSL